MEIQDMLNEINADNYIRDLRTWQSAMQPKKRSIMAGRIGIIVAIAFCVYAVIQIINHSFIGVYMGFMVAIMSGTYGFMTMAWAKAFAKQPEKIIKQAEEDIANARYQKAYMFYGSCRREDFIRHADRSKLYNANQLYIPMKIYDARNHQINFRFNGRQDCIDLLEPGEKIEITYLADSRIINSITIIK